MFCFSSPCADQPLHNPLMRCYCGSQTKAGDRRPAWTADGTEFTGKKKGNWSNINMTGSGDAVKGCAFSACLVLCCFSPPWWQQEGLAGDRCHPPAPCHPSSGIRKSQKCHNPRAGHVLWVRCTCRAASFGTARSKNPPRPRSSGDANPRRWNGTRIAAGCESLASCSPAP